MEGKNGGDPFNPEFSQSAARALLENTDLSPLEIVTKSLEIAGDLCIYTNRNFTLETLE